MPPLLSLYARRRKLRYFTRHLASGGRVLEVGAGSGWFGEALREAGFQNYTGLDRAPPADVVGDVRDWRELGLEPGGFDALVAFEVVEHGDFYGAFAELLRPGGLLLLTTPLPAADPLLKVFERLGLNQTRTSPHSNLHRLRDLPGFDPVEVRTVAGLSQWGVFRRRAAD